MLQKNQMKKRLKNKGILGITDFEKCRKMSKEGKRGDWQCEQLKEHHPHWEKPYLKAFF